MKRIIAIYENDYGCEERSEDESLKYLVVLQDEDGNEEEILAEDKYLTDNSLDVGSVWITPKED